MEKNFSSHYAVSHPKKFSYSFGWCVKKSVLVLMIVFLFIAWSDDPTVNTPVCTAQNTQVYPRIVSDGFSGAIITWQDNRAGNYDIYVQHLDVSGTSQWQNNGVGLCTLPANQEYPEIVSDGSGGAIITWRDARNGSDYDIYAQHIDSTGTVLWTTGGVGICVVGGDQECPRIVSDGSDGAIITWKDGRNGSDYNIYAQRINPAGNILWTAGGVPICRARKDQQQQQLISDGHNGAIITWTDKRGNDEDIYAQRIDSAGSLLWSGDGVAICTAANSQYDPQLVRLGSGGAIIVWIDKRASSSYCQRYDIYAHRINASGAAVWDTDGVLVEPEYYYEPEGLGMVPDGSGGAIISWTDYNCPFQVWVEVKQINGSGQSLWHAYPTYWGEGYNARLLPDGHGGAIITWSDDVNGTDGNIHAQRLNNSGQKLWGSYGVSVCTRSGQQSGPQIISNGTGGAIITWYDEDIYAQNVCNSGGLGACTDPIAVMNRLRYGGIVPADIEFDGSGSFDPDGTITEWSWRFGDGTTGSKKKLNHTYPEVGLYWTTLRVKDNTNRWSAKTKAVVKTYALDNLEVKINVTSTQIKASGKEGVQVNSGCYEKDTDPGREERPVPVDLGLKYTTTAGSWQDNMIFGGGMYSRTLLSGEPGTATVKTVLKDKVLGTIKIQFTWPQPPVNLKAELKENRSLLRGEYYAYLSWSANSKETYKPEKYLIYRSTDGGAFELAAEVSAATFTYVDKCLPAGSQYRYAVSTVDSDGDESALSTAVPAQLRGERANPTHSTKGRQGIKK